jgi:hypothetical protein
MHRCAQKRINIDPLSPIIMIHVADLDYVNGQVKCINNIKHRLLINKKYYSLVQVSLHGGPSNFWGVTVINGCYIMYDNSLRAFGKERNRVKYMGGMAPFSTRGNVYYVSNLWCER